MTLGKPMTHRRFAAGVMLCTWLAASGCTTLREIPRSEYAARPERKAVRVWTHEGLEYEFDYATVSHDTLVGYRQREVEGPVDQVAVLRFALADIDRLSARSVDWYRTGLVGGGVLAAVIAAGLTATNRNDDNGDDSAGGGGPRVP